MNRKQLTKREKDEIGRECVNCHATQDLAYHHIVPLSMGGKDEISNMICLCKKCHCLIHFGEKGEINHLEAIKRGKQAPKDNKNPRYYSQAQNRATQKYLAENKDQLRLWVAKGVKTDLTLLAKEAGVSVTRYVSNAVNAYAGRNVMMVSDMTE